MTIGRASSTIAKRSPSIPANSILYVVSPRKLFENIWPPMTTFHRVAKIPIWMRITAMK